MNEVIENEQANPINELIYSFDQKRKNCIEYLENNELEEQDSNFLKVRKTELDMVIVLLEKHGQDHEIQRVAEDLNEAFSYLDFNRDAPRKLDTSFFRNGKEQRKKLADKIESTLQRILTKEQINLLSKESFSADPEALVDLLLYWKGYDKILKQKLVSLPKKDRDKAIKCLQDELDSYKYLSSEKFVQNASNDIAKTGKIIIENQSEYFEGARGMFQKSLEILIGERFAELMRPINYDEEDIKKIEEVVFQNIKALQHCFDKEAFDELINQCIRLKKIEKDHISPEEAKDFITALDSFRHSYTLPEAITNAQRELTAFAYLYSHGNKNSIFENDSTVLGNIFHTKSGQDNLRTLIHISPFRWGLQEDVNLKPYKERLEQFIEDKNKLSADEKKKMSLEVYVSQGETKTIRGWNNIKKAGKAEEYFKKKSHGDIDSVRIPSYWELGYWEEHDSQSMAAQTATVVAIAKAPSVIGAIVKNTPVVSHIGKLAVKISPTLRAVSALSPAMNLAWQAYMGMKIGEGINEANK